MVTAKSQPRAASLSSLQVSVLEQAQEKSEDVRQMTSLT
jgi:hypothetical protein